MIADVEKIVEEIREEVAAQEKKCGIPAAEECVSLLSLKNNGNISLQEELDFLAQKANVPARRPLFCNRPVVGGLLLWMKKVIRRLVRFYVEPLVLDQNEWNTHSVHMMRMLSDLAEENQQRTEQLKRQIDFQQERIRELEAALEQPLGGRVW
ncbi:MULTISPECIES: hypothetical protein [Clostridia]|uniref:hypothetical protein n=1 Tax=Clostridia TaxID=186801 RepID=UPI000EA314D7|nr:MULTISPECIES: hypothetical protein [Clostridia]NBK19497.1 hypothetical protein [Anaerotruncus sp. 1XD42-93]RKJ80061.1 hypothetical protein D7Y41_27160 [Anaerotruncus sp. 1XD22-93]